MTDPRDSGRVLDRDLAPVASLIGDPTRIAILAALAEGHALPAGELARRAGVHPATATAHLRQLVDGGLVSVRVQGRHRYHELAGPKSIHIWEYNGHEGGGPDDDERAIRVLAELFDSENVTGS